MPTIAWLEEDLTLETAGGKGVNLALMTRAGFPVPPGFVVTTEAYREHVVRNHLDGVIASSLDDLGEGIEAIDPAALDAASARIRAAFEGTTLATETREALHSAYADLGVRLAQESPRVAVRSSATAEDLPDLSFAGQQDTFLGVHGDDALAAAVVACWSSLWTARAIGYRAKIRIDADDVALAVVVQFLVDARASGVLFTANPLTGARGETVIDATLGLGEALVSGLVEPDHIVADSSSGMVTARTRGAKGSVTRLTDLGSETVESQERDLDALDDTDVRSLVELGRAVQAHYGTPQDIEWAFDSRAAEPYLLQTRAVTSLYPIPPGSLLDGRDGRDLGIYASFGAVQGMLLPLTPLGQDAIRLFFDGGAKLFGADLDYADNPYVVTAGERLWIRLDLLLRHPIGHAIAPVFLGFVEPSVAKALEPFLATRHAAPSSRTDRRAIARTAARLSVLVRRVPASVLDPAAARRTLDSAITGLLDDVAAREADASGFADPVLRLHARVTLMRTALVAGFPLLGPRFGPMIMPGMALLNGIGVLAGVGRMGGPTLELTRAVPGNPTTEMDLALWDVAVRVRQDGEVTAYIAETDVPTLAADYLHGRLPATAQGALADFLERYGMRGVAEIDFGRPRWREAPDDVVATLKAYVSMSDPSTAPDALFRRGLTAADRAAEELVHEARRAPAGPIRARVVQALTGRIRTLIAARELPKFTIVRIFGIVRSGLLASGDDLVAAGMLERADDIVFLHLAELEHLAVDWRAGSVDGTSLRDLVAHRRAVYERESARTRVPRLLLGDGRAIYEGVGDTSGADIVGSPVSPGVADGIVHVIRDPSREHLAPGEVLVCVGTDPGWTPLFLSACALVTEVGGMMTHGSVVAREYGIPAVVGVHEATTRLRTGERVRIDGSAGTITRLSEPSDD